MKMSDFEDDNYSETVLHLAESILASTKEQLNILSLLPLPLPLNMHPTFLHTLQDLRNGAKMLLVLASRKKDK